MITYCKLHLTVNHNIGKLAPCSFTQSSSPKLKSPVKWSRQKVCGCAQPASPTLWVGANPGHCFVLLLCGALILRQVVGQLCVLFYFHRRILEWNQHLTQRTCEEYYESAWHRPEVKGLLYSSFQSPKYFGGALFLWKCSSYTEVGPTAEHCVSTGRQNYTWKLMRVQE